MDDRAEASLNARPHLSISAFCVLGSSVGSLTRMVEASR